MEETGRGEGRVRLSETPSHGKGRLETNNIAKLEGCISQGEHGVDRPALAVTQARKAQGRSCAVEMELHKMVQQNNEVVARWPSEV